MPWLNITWVLDAVSTKMLAPSIVVVRSLFGAIVRWLKMPKLQFGPLKDTAGVAHLAWWHMPVWLERRLLSPFPLVDVGVRLVFMAPALGQRTLCWKRLDPGPPEYRTTLRVGDGWRYIPLVARTEEAARPLSGYEGDIISPDLVAGWLLRRGIPRVTDGNHFFLHEQITNLEGPQDYKVALELISNDGKNVAKRSFILHVPEPNARNADFFLRDTLP